MSGLYEPSVVTLWYPFDTFTKAGGSYRPVTKGQACAPYLEAVDQSHARMQPPTYRPGLFTIDGLEGFFRGFTTGTHWNGWARPVFEHETALRICEAFRSQSTPDNVYYADYDSEADAFLVRDPADDEAVAFESAVIAVDGSETTVYMFGTDFWTWEEPEHLKREIPE